MDVTHGEAVESAERMTENRAAAVFVAEYMGTS